MAVTAAKDRHGGPYTGRVFQHVSNRQSPTVIDAYYYTARIG